MQDVTVENSKYDELVKVAQSLAIVHNLLNQGLYQGAARNDLNQSISFIEELHKKVMQDLEPMMKAKEESEAQSEVEVASV